MHSAIVLPPIWAWAKVLLCDSSTLIIADDCDIAIEWLLSFKTSNHIWFSSTRQLFGQVDTLRKQNVAVGGVGVIQHTDKRHVYYLVTKKSSYQKPTYADLSSSLHAMKNHMVLDTAITAMNIENHWFRIVFLFVGIERCFENCDAPDWMRPWWIGVEQSQGFAAWNIRQRGHRDCRLHLQGVGLRCRSYRGPTRGKI